MKIAGLLALSFCLSSISAAPYYSSDRQEQVSMRKLYDTVQNLRYELANHEAKLHTLTEQICTQEDMIEALKDEIDQAKMLQNGTSSLHEDKIQDCVSDLQQLKNSTSLFDKYQNKLSQLESTVGVQTEHIDHLKSAMRSLMDALQASEGEPTEDVRIYRVQSGDSLGLIAQKFNTTIRDLKSFNKLPSDTIIIGQRLKIPKR